MENRKQSLYTKYRPKTFDQVVGQKVAKEILVNSISKNKINHAYLFYGIRGTGKTTLARIFAKAINCENPTNFNPCNECPVCISINTESSFDVIEIDAASNNGVDEIRTIKENTNYLTNTANYKVYIIDEVHMLSKAAFNALLKTLEEPPQNTIFLLATTELHKIPQTVLSRTVVINLEVMSDQDIKEGLEVILKGENVNYDPESLEYIVMTSGGSLRDGISALETTLLYNDDLSVDNVLSALGLINKAELERLITTDINGLIASLDATDKDPRKLSLLILEVIMHLIKNGDIKYVSVVNSLVNTINTVKDPLLLRIALKSAFYSVNVPRETLSDEQIVPRETLPKEPILQSKIVESVDNSPLEPKIEQNVSINPTNTVVDNQVDNSTNGVDNNVGKNTQINTENTPNSANKEPNSDELDIITDHAGINNYLYVMKNNDSKALPTINSRWKFLSSYITRSEYKEIVSILMTTKPLVLTNKTIIVGFNSDEAIKEYKRVSLTPVFFNFIKELTGEYRFVLPINNETWKKLCDALPTIEFDDRYNDLEIKLEDYIVTKEQETLNKAHELFGKDNISHE